MLETIKKLNPVPPIKRVIARLRKWWRGPEPTVIAPEEISLVPIPPPTLRIEIVFPEQPVEVIDEPVTIHPLAVDSQLKRMSVLATRYGRLPFGRRFTTPPADGTIAAADRLIIGMSYAGIAAGEEVEPQTPSVMIKRIVRDPRIRPARLPRQMVGRVNEWREWS